MSYNVYFEDVEVGQEIPAFERKTDFMKLEPLRRRQR